MERHYPLVGLAKEIGRFTKLCEVVLPDYFKGLHKCYQERSMYICMLEMIKTYRRLNLCTDGINTLRPRQNCSHFADDTFKHIFVNENVRISIKISLKFVPNGPINNIPALVQIMAWRRPGDKPSSETMIFCLPTHVCVTRPQWVKDHRLTELWQICDSVHKNYLSSILKNFWKK